MATITPNKKVVARLVELKPMARKYATNQKEAIEFVSLVAKEHSRGVSLDVLAKELGYTSDLTLRDRLAKRGLLKSAQTKFRANKKKHTAKAPKASTKKQSPAPSYREVAMMFVCGDCGGSQLGLKLK